MHKLTVFEQTTYVDTAHVDLTDEQFETLNGITNAHERQAFLMSMTDGSEWTTGDFVDGERPHYYEIDGEGKDVWEELT